MKPADQLQLQFDLAPVLLARAPNMPGIMLGMARTSYPRHDAHRDIHRVLWSCLCGRIVGIKGASL